MSENPEESKRSLRQTNALVRALVEQETLDYPFWVSGIVTRCFVSDFGHVYFDLTDEDYSINCMVRQPVRGTLNFTFSNGIEVEVFGTVRVYEKAAKIQIEVEQARHIETPKPVLDATVLEQLKAKGVWPRTKLPLPNTINHIGVVTSKQSQALHDFEDHYRREGGTASCKVIDVRLQGQQAPREIADAINRFNREKQVEVIVITRGGGRASELTVFNDPLIVEAICRSAIPVITGIGHQRDDTLADQVADFSAITPTAAASYLAKQLRSLPTPSQPASKSRGSLYCRVFSCSCHRYVGYRLDNLSIAAMLICT